MKSSLCKLKTFCNNGSSVIAIHKRLSGELGVSINFNMFNLKGNRLHQQFFFHLMRPIHKENNRICLSPRGNHGIRTCTLVQNSC